MLFVICFPWTCSQLVSYTLTVLPETFIALNHSSLKPKEGVVIVETVETMMCE